MDVGGTEGEPNKTLATTSLKHWLIISSALTRGQEKITVNPVGGANVSSTEGGKTNVLEGYSGPMATQFTFMGVSFNRPLK